MPTAIPNAIKLIKSYLSNRKQYVEIHGTKSNLGSIDIGVPQGSILGPLLFLIYINDIVESSKTLQAIMYADDSTFSSAIHQQNDSETEKLMNSELSKVDAWLKSNRLCLNLSKTKFMIFSRSKSTKTPKISINGTNIERVNEFNFLGLKITENLGWSRQTNDLSKKLSRGIGIIRRLSKFLPKRILTTIYYTLFHSHLTYMLLAWGYDSNTILQKQKQVIRIINGKHFLSHTDPLFKNNKILKITDMHTMAQLKFCHRYVRDDLPDYFINDMTLTRNCDNHLYFTRHLDHYVDPRPASEGGRKILRNSIPILMNNLPNMGIYEAFYAGKVNAMASLFKKNTFESYSDIERCIESGCYSCSLVYPNPENS